MDAQPGPVTVHRLRASDHLGAPEPGHEGNHIGYIERVALQVGWGDTSHFSRQTPSRWRRDHQARRRRGGAGG